jgi:hypothetical protein
MIEVTRYGRLSKYTVREAEDGEWVHEATGKRFAVIVDSSVWAGGSVERMTPESVPHLSCYSFTHEGERWLLVPYKAMTIVNLTPHPICISAGGSEETFQPDPRGPARVGSEPGRQLHPHERPAPTEIPLFQAPKWNEVEGLPAPEEGTIYIVSSLVASRCVGRPDVFSPGTGPKDGAIRDESGRITAVTCLIQAPMEEVTR